MTEMRTNASAPSCKNGECVYTCNSGYVDTGTACVNYCSSSPCRNGGVCSNGTSTYLCNCDNTGYHGTTCNMDDCETKSCPIGTSCKHSGGSVSCVSLCGNSVIDGEEECDPKASGWSNYCSSGSGGCKRTVYKKCQSDTNGGDCTETYGGYQQICSARGYCQPMCQNAPDQCPKIPGADVICSYYCILRCKSGSCPNLMTCNADGDCVS